MLGKGLESLIPNKGSNGGDADNRLRLAGNEELPPGQKEELLPPGHEHEGGPLILSTFPHEPQSGVASPASAPIPDPVPPLQVPAEKSPTVPVPAPTPAVPAPTRPASKPEPAPKAPDAIFHIEVDKIRPNPNQPRRNFDEQALKDLAASIREFGILQPLVVTKIEREVPTGTQVEYELIAGERRLLAAKSLGLERVPAIIRRIEVPRQSLELAIIENLQRENLSPIEMARAYARLQDEFRLTQREIAAQLGKSREVIANTVRLLDLPPEIQEAVDKGRITESHGRLLLAIEEPGAQQKVFRDLLEKHLTTRELQERVAAFKKPRAEKPATRERVSPEMHMLEEQLSSQLGTPVKISQSGETGKITITFYSKEELDNILQHLGKGDDI